MVDRDREAIKALTGVTFPPGSNAKWFVRQMSALSADPAAMWTPKQHEYLWDLVYHYRRQIADEKLIAEGQAVHNSLRHRGLEV